MTGREWLVRAQAELLAADDMVCKAMISLSNARCSEIKEWAEAARLDISTSIAKTVDALESSDD